MNKDFETLRRVVTRYESYILKKKLDYEKSRIVETAKKNIIRQSLFFTPSDENEETSTSTPTPIARIKFKTLKDFIVRKVSDRPFMANRAILNVLTTREYDKHDVDYMVALCNLLRKDINDMIEQEEKRMLEEKMLQQQREEDEKRRIDMIIPRFSTGMQMHSKEWNEFAYIESDETKELVLNNTSVGEMFVNVFLSLSRSIIDEEALISIANAVNCPVDRAHLAQLPMYRSITHALGFILQNPMIEKELNEHVSYLCMFLWWHHYAQEKDVSDKINVDKQIVESHEAMQDQYVTRFCPLFRKAINVLKRREYEISPRLSQFFDRSSITDYLMSSDFDHTIRGIDKVFIDHDQSKIELFKQWIAFVIIDINDCFSELFKGKIKDIERKTDQQNVMIISNMDENASMPATEISDFFDGEKLLSWFVDTNISKNMLFSRFSTIYISKADGSIEHKFVIGHNAAEYINYQKYGMLRDYVNETAIVRIIPAEDRNQSPMMNLLNYLFVFFASVTTNPSSFENEPQELSHLVFENMFLMMIYLIERNGLSGRINWWRVCNYTSPRSLDKISARIQSNVFDHAFDKNVDYETIIFRIIFEEISKQCFFSAGTAIINFFLMNTCFETSFIQTAIENNAMFRKKSVKDASNPFVQFVTGSKRNQENGCLCISMIMAFLFNETNRNSVARFIVALRTIQHSYHEICSKKPTNSTRENVNPIEKLEQDFFRRVGLVIKNKKYQELLCRSDDGTDFVTSVVRLSSFGAKEAINTLIKNTTKAVLNSVISNVIRAFFLFMTKKLSAVDQNSILDYVAKYMMKIISTMVKIEHIDLVFFNDVAVDHGIKQNGYFSLFFEELCRFCQSLSSQSEDRIIAHLFIQFEACFKNKPANMTNFTKLHEFARSLILLRICYMIDSQDEMTSTIKRTISDKRNLFIELEQKKVQRSVSNDPICTITGMQQTLIPSDMASIFECNQTSDITDAFDDMNIFFQTFALLSHHFLWKNVSSSAINIFMQRFYNKSLFDFEIYSYNDINEESSYTIKKRIRFDVDTFDRDMSLILSFEHFIIEKTGRHAHTLSSLSQMYGVSERCRRHLEEMNIRSIDLVAHTPESKMIGWMMTFLKAMIARAFDRASKESRYPEDGFAIIISQEKTSTLELMQTVSNYISSIYSRIVLSASISSHVHVKQSLDDDKTIYDAADFVMNPLKYCIKDALLNHPFHVRMLQIYVKNRSTIISRAWLILPLKVTEKHIGDGRNNEKTLSFINKNSVQVELFSKKHNPKNYIMWRFWFMNLPFIDNTILLKHNKPLKGHAYFLYDEAPPMPSGHSDPLVLKSLNIMTNSACSSSSST
jgi:hypothetical protein